VNQAENAGTTLLFSTYVDIALRTMGIQMSARERRAYYHLWRYIFHLLGIPPEIVPASESDAWRLTAVNSHIYCTSDDQDAVRLADALMQAVPDVYGVNGNRALSRLTQRALIRAHQDHLRLLFGRPVAEHLGLAPLSPAISVLMALAPPTFLAETLRRIIPGASRIALNRGLRSRQAWLERAAARTQADLTLTREDPAAGREAMATTP
jgi:hypothetical protein